MNTVVIYHSADFDGIFCREIARKFLPGATLIGWNYGQPTPGKDTLDTINDTTQLYILDLSVPDLMDHPNLIWIDHHKSAIDRYPGSTHGYRLDGVAACRLAWQWFTMGVTPGFQPDIDKKYYIERTVSEPLAVRLVGEYDVWDRRDPNAELFQHGLRSQDLTPEDWATLLEWPDESGGKLTIRLLNQGRALQYAKTKENASIITSNGFTLQWEGLTFLACNAARNNSLLFAAGVMPQHDALLGFNYDGKGKWKVSLYHAPGKEHHDLSQIAVKYGGGGHRGACGMTFEKLPFIQAV